MNIRDEFEDQVPGQMSIEDILEPNERLFAVSRIYARARKEMNLAEQKCFVLALSQLRFTEAATQDCVLLDKKKLASALGMESNSTDLSKNLYRAVKDLWRHSGVEIAEPDLDLYSSGNIISAVTKYQNKLRVRFNLEYLPLFTGLSDNYITMWSADIFQMKSIRSVQFYEYLRQETDTRENINCRGLSTRKIKEMFDIPESGKGSYMRTKGGFNRAEFEQRVIQPLCDDLKNCRMINLVMQSDGKMYEKVKQGSRVLGYRFYWTFTSHPAVATASEVKQIQDRVDREPQVLKVAKDILTGEQRKKAKGKTTGSEKFNDFEQRSYDYNDLERKLAQMN